MSASHLLGLQGPQQTLAIAFWYLCNLNLHNFYIFHRVEDLTKTWQDIVQDSTRGQGNQARKGRSFVAFYGSRINVAEMSGKNL